MRSPAVEKNRPAPLWWIAVVVLYLGLYAAWLSWGRTAGWPRVLISHLALFFPSLLAFYLAGRTWQQVSAAPLRRAWACFTAGLGLWALGDLLRLLLQNGAGGSVADFSLLDGVYLLGSLSFWAGLLSYPRSARPAFGRLGLFIDTAMTATAAVTLVWVLVLQPAQAGMLYPLTDLFSLLLLTILFLLSDVRRLPGALGWFVLGVIAYTLSDLTYAARLVEGAYLPGGWLDAGWVLGDGLVALAALTQLTPQPADPLPGSWSMRILSRLQNLLPLIATLVLGWYAIFDWTRTGQADSPALWVTVVLALGLVARQGILTGEIEMQKYANLVNSVAEPAFVCDRRGRLQLINPALLQTAGHANPADLLERPLEDLFHPVEGLAAALGQGLENGWSGELWLKRKGGEMLPVSLALRPLLPAADRRLALAGTAHNLSEIKQQQKALRTAYNQIAADRTELEQLNTQLEGKVAEKTANLSQALQQLEQQNIRLQKLDELKSDFVSLVSHELRAPLTNINAGIELLLAGSGHTTQTLELVQAEIRRLARFVETILDLSALDAGRLPLYPAPMPLEGCRAALVRQMEHLPGANRVTWKLPSDLPLVLADEQALTSVLFHLLDNAFKYAPQGGITVQAEIEGSQMRVDVLDEGSGISAGALPLLFDRFYRSNPADAQTVYGHGLGLYIVRRLMEAMHGTVQAENRPQGGACFSLWLPVESGEEGVEHAD